MYFGCKPFLFPIFVRCISGLALAGSGLLCAQAPLTASGQIGPLASAPEALPSAPATRQDSFAAWNELLRDVTQIGIRAAVANGSISSGVGSGPLETALPGESSPATAGMANQPATSPGNGSMQPGAIGTAGRGGGPGPQMGNSMQTNGFAHGPGGGRPDGQPGGSLNLGFLFQLAGGLGRGLNSSGYTGLGTALGMLPTLSQLTRAGINLPVASLLGNFRVSYQSPLNLAGMNGTSPTVRGYGSGFAAYDSPHARSGRLDFSASALMGTSSGMGGQGGASGGMGSGGPGGHGPGGGHGGGSSQSQPSASVSLHLSF